MGTGRGRFSTAKGLFKTGGGIASDYSQKRPTPGTQAGLG